MDINDIPVQTAVFIDSNIFIYHFAGISQQCSRIIRQIERKKYKAYITNIIIAEVIHRRMIAEAIQKNIATPKNVLKKLKSNPELVKNLSEYSKDVSNILLLPLTIISINQEDIMNSQGIRDQYGLMTNDSLNLACLKRLNIVDIITHDSDYDRISYFKIWKPTDL